MGITREFYADIVHCPHLSPQRHRGVWIRNVTLEAPVLFVESSGSFMTMSNRTLLFECESCFIKSLEKSRETLEMQTRLHLPSGS